MRRSIFWLALSALWVATALPLAPQAHASVVSALDLDTLLARSHAVVLARTLAKESHWADGRIVTLVQAQVERCELGAHSRGELVTMVQWGGVVGDVGMRRFGEPEYREGQRHLLFLRQLEDARYRPVGLRQGVLTVQTRQGVDWVVPDLEGLALVQPIDKRLGGTARAAFEAPEPLDQALGRIRQRLAR